ncbi:hypothetical protein RN001_009199 [Aquatica leii]|uniref:GH16 domain-containing protein n=1 Tax=Aquatica leii TaxID=1421715 RepID=A0AAN7QFY7_9COLE|nr:hypothetical protein RN001_009199 [Aquatica leii]
MSWLLSVLCFLFLSTVHHINGVDGLKTFFTTTAETTYATSSTSRAPTRITEEMHNSSMARTTPKTPSHNLCQVSFTKVNGKYSCKGKLIFQEMFINISTQWKRENKFAGDPDFEFVIYSNNKTNVFAKHSMLYINPTLTEERYGVGYVNNPRGIDFGNTCTGFPETLECVQKPRAWQVLPSVISAQISTKNSFSFLYGVIEVKAKFPAGDWLYPEISLVPKSEVYGPGLESGRIRIGFSPGNKDLGNHLWGGCTLGYTDAARKYAMRQTTSEQPWHEDFHTYKVQWKVDSIILFVDNEVYGTIYPPPDGFASEALLEIDPFTTERWMQGTQLAPFDQEMYIVIGVGAGGQMFFEDTEVSKPWANNDPKAQLRFYKKSKEWFPTWENDSQLIVDYVKVWAV